MDIKLQSALIAAAVSLLAAIIGFITVKKQLQAQREKTEKEFSSAFLHKAYELRLSLYPAAFAITAQAGKVYEKPTSEVAEIHQEIADALKKWRNSEVMLVISDYALERSYDLERELRKNPDKPKSHFSEEQRRRMWGKRQKFRHALRSDLGLLLKEK